MVKKWITNNKNIFKKQMSEPKTEKKTFVELH